MKNTKHTPGPWFIVDSSNGDWPNGDWPNGDWPNGCELCIDDVEGGNPETDYCIASAVQGDPDTLAANARLIAAAPELLAALEKLCSTAESTAGRLKWEDIQEARTAIAKATGA